MTVGSFDSVGSKRPDGKIDLNPKIHEIMKNFGAAPNQTPNQAGTVEAKSLAGVPFDIQPIPVHVPKISVSAGNDQTASLLR